MIVEVTFKNSEELSDEIINNSKINHLAFNKNLEINKGYTIKSISITESLLNAISKGIINELLRKDYIRFNNNKYIVNDNLCRQYLLDELIEEAGLKEVDYFKTSGISEIDNIIAGIFRINVNLKAKEEQERLKRQREYEREREYREEIRRQEEQAAQDAICSIFTLMSCM